MGQKGTTMSTFTFFFFFLHVAQWRFVKYPSWIVVASGVRYPGLRA